MQRMKKNGGASPSWPVNRIQLWVGSRNLWEKATEYQPSTARNPLHLWRGGCQVLPSINRPIGVAELKLAKVLPDNLVGKLPDPAELRKNILQDIKKK